MSSTFGKIFTLTTFGESHGAGIGGIVDGCPSGIDFDIDFIQNELDKRKPGAMLAKHSGTTRKEDDKIKILSGVYNGKTTGTPIAFLMENTNQHSGDYTKIMNVFRPGHADITYDAKYGFRDPRGGGRSSARETAARVAGGAIAQLFLKTMGIEVYAFPVALDGIYATEFGGIDCFDKKDKDLQIHYLRPFYAPNDEVVSHWEKRVSEVKEENDSLGGLVCVLAHNVPAGIGEPVFDKLDARLASAIMGVGSVKGVEIGAGFSVSMSRGSQNNDAMIIDKKTAQFQFLDNNAGGILGGISTGESIHITAAIKPIPSIAQKQMTVTKQKENSEISIGGRHDISAIPRIVPVLSAMTALTLADMILMQRRMQHNTTGALITDLLSRNYDDISSSKSLERLTNEHLERTSFLNTSVFPNEIFVHSLFNRLLNVTTAKTQKKTSTNTQLKKGSTKKVPK